MRELKILLSTAALLAGLAVVPPAQAQISIDIGVQPVCSYGYYGYAPYACAPMGYYGSGYFYDGIFVGMGPWSGWGYSHGWGSHRFHGDGGGSFHGGVGRVAYSGRQGSGNPESRGEGGARVNSGASNAGGARPSPSHNTSHSASPRGETSHVASHSAVPRGGTPHSAGGQAHGGQAGSHDKGEDKHAGGDHK
jgi:hypothetical protein